MRVVVSEFISLDGVVQAPGGPEEDTEGGFAHGGWTEPYFDAEVVGGAFAESLAEAGALLFGRRTWLTMAAAWPERAGDPFADLMNSLKKYVVSGSLEDAELLAWNNSERIPADRAVARVRELRADEGEETGRDLVVMGSPSLVRALLSAGLVDRLQLIVMPVVLGGGKTIFPADGTAHPFQMVSTITAKTGAQVSVYEPIRRPADEA
ncbi:dihydrofolate reductase family protein [Streptomyces sp. NPDC005423]|uniref:dihydrofolate reductase family protein n=1 Tax=Streptomyces sp. NPDC005423 TaxID=3155343 RepID=UPI0033AFA732